MKRVIIYLLLLCLLIATGAGVYLWNKPHRNIENVKSVVVEAAVLSGAFETDEPAANRQYLNQPLTVNGVVDEVEENASGQLVILLKGNNDFSGVQCTMEEGTEVVKPSKGERISISGFCNGYTTVVILGDCKFVK